MARSRTAPTFSRGTALSLGAALLLVTALTLLAVLATTTSASINDSDASPQSWWVIDTAGGSDVALDVAVNSAGTAYVCGQVRNAAGNLDGSLYKFPLSGAGWRKTWDGPAHANDAFYAVAVAPDGRIYTAGANRNAAGQLDMRLVKWSPAGDVLWTRRYTGPVAGDDTATDVVVDANGNVTVCGDSQGTKGKAFTVVSWTAGGTLRWVRRIEGVVLSDDRANAMIVDGSGNLYVTGKRSWEIGMAGYTVKLSSGNVKRWSHTYTGADSVELTAITKRPGGGAFVCGKQLGFDTGWDGLVISYTGAGTRLVFPIDVGDGLDSTDTSYDSVVATPTGKVGVAGGVSYDYGATYARYGRIFDSATGAVVGTLSNVDSYPQRMAAVAADAYGGLYFTGTDALSASHTAIWTQRSSTIPGGGSWTGTYATTAVALNKPTAIATWRTTVWVVGQVYPGGGDGDQMVLKYLY